MNLSAPIYRLKRNARLLSRDANIPLHEALDRLAREEGFKSWNLLVKKASETSPPRLVFATLEPGDLVLVGARPGEGKTLMSLELAVEAMKAGNRGVLFSLEFTPKDILGRFVDIEADWKQFEGLFEFDDSDSICADYIVRKLAAAPIGTLVVIDYLQLLDQKRENPELSIQIQTLKSFARERGIIVVFISQIDRSYDSSAKPLPDAQDIRLPNPLDLKLFDKMCFLNGGEVHFEAAS